jgi:hypothetical protein
VVRELVEDEEEEAPAAGAAARAGERHQRRVVGEQDLLLRRRLDEIPQQRRGVDDPLGAVDELDRLLLVGGDAGGGAALAREQPLEQFGAEEAGVDRRHLRQRRLRGAAPPGDDLQRRPLFDRLQQLHLLRPHPLAEPEQVGVGGRLGQRDRLKFAHARSALRHR